MTGITDPAQEYFKDGTWGWDGTQWRKLPMLFGYSARWAESDSGAASGAGNATAETATVLAGYIYVCQAASAYHNAGANKILAIRASGGGVECTFDFNAAQPSGEWLVWSGDVLLEEGDKIEAVATSPGDTKSAFLRVWGYKMKIAE